MNRSCVSHTCRIFILEQCFMVVSSYWNNVYILFSMESHTCVLSHVELHSYFLLIQHYMIGSPALAVDCRGTQDFFSGNHFISTYLFCSLYYGAWFISGRSPQFLINQYYIRVSPCWSGNHCIRKACYDFSNI